MALIFIIIVSHALYSFFFINLLTNNITFRTLMSKRKKKKPFVAKDKGAFSLQWRVAGRRRGSRRIIRHSNRCETRIKASHTRVSAMCLGTKQDKQQEQRYIAPHAAHRCFCCCAISLLILTEDKFSSASHTHIRDMFRYYSQLTQEDMRFFICIKQSVAMNDAPIIQS